MPRAPTAYEVLGVPEDTPQRELAAVYRARVRALHVNGQPKKGHEAHLRALNAVWALVGTPERRAAYDVKLKEAREAAAAALRNRPDVQAAREMAKQVERAAQPPAPPAPSAPPGKTPWYREPEIRSFAIDVLKTILKK